MGSLYRLFPERGPQSIQGYCIKDGVQTDPVPVRVKKQGADQVENMPQSTELLKKVGAHVLLTYLVYHEPHRKPHAKVVIIICCAALHPIPQDAMFCPPPHKLNAESETVQPMLNIWQLGRALYKLGKLLWHSVLTRRPSIPAPSGSFRTTEHTTVGVDGIMSQIDGDPGALDIQKE